MKTSNIDDLLGKYIDDFLTKKNDPMLSEVIVEPSIPIVWFGDLEKYEKSEKRIVTIGLNPSLSEFSEKRFDIIDFSNQKRTADISSLKKTLNGYFKNNPYNWFSRGEHVLNQFNASYYELPHCDNRAIHIDIYTAIATNPTWGKLDKTIKKQLTSQDLFKKLLEYLNPDIILISTNKPIFLENFKNFNLENEKYEKSGNTRSFYIRKYRYDDKTLYWFYNNRGTAFGLGYDFIDQTINEML